MTDFIEGIVGMNAPFNRDPHVFMAPEFAGIVERAIAFFSNSPMREFPPNYPNMNGRGVYGLYYFGDYPLYTSIAAQNKATGDRPIYIGKAVSTGRRTGVSREQEMSIAGRVREHSQSINAARNLNIEDFHCRFIFLQGTEEDLIEVLESRLIKKFQPLWNSPYLAGFGNHDPGSGRYNQQRSAWDTLHPGRAWANRLKENQKSKEEILANAYRFLQGRLPPTLISSDDPPKLL